MPFARDDLDSNCRRSACAIGRGELATCLGQHGWGGCHGGRAGAAAAPGARETASMGRARAADRAEGAERRAEDGVVVLAVLQPESSCVRRVLAKCSMCPRRKCGSRHPRTGPARLPPSPASRDGEARARSGQARWASALGRLWAPQAPICNPPPSRLLSPSRRRASQPPTRPSAVRALRVASAVPRPLTNRRPASCSLHASSPGSPAV
jgi:hypothetical protein